MSILPQTNDKFIDILTINSFKLAVYPSFLVFGEPVFENYCLNFPADQYILIKEFQLSQWFTFLDKLGQIIGHPEDFRLDNNIFDKETLIVSNDSEDEVGNVDLKKLQNFCSSIIKFEEKTSTITVSLIGNFSQKVTFHLNEFDCYLFVQSFKTLFFKLYCYDSNISFYLLKVINQCDMECLEDETGNNFFEYIQKIYSFQTNQIHYMTELILRHRKLFIQYKNLKIPDCYSDDGMLLPKRGNYNS